MLSDAVDSALNRRFVNWKAGTRGTALRWIQSFLPRGRLRVGLDAVLPRCASEARGGGPQGFLLGPALFLLFINDQDKVKFITKLYADDANIFSSLATKELRNPLSGKYRVPRFLLGEVVFFHS